MTRASLVDLENHQDFIQRHIGPTTTQQAEMAKTLGYDSLEELISATVPAAIRRENAMDLPGAQTEQAVIGAQPQAPMVIISARRWRSVTCRRRRRKWARRSRSKFSTNGILRR